MTDASLETPAAPPVIPVPAQPNTPEARTPDGTLKDAQTPTTPEAPVAPETPPAKTPEAPAVPEKYDFKAPEGQTLDPAVIEKATPIFKELGLSNDAAQKLVDFYNAQAREGKQMVDSMRTEWKAEVAKLPELVTNPRAVEDLGRAKAVIFENDPKGLAAFNEAMDLTGAGDNPAIVRGWLRAAARLVEGGHVSGRTPSPEGQTPPDKAVVPTAAQALYPNLPSATH